MPSESAFHAELEGIRKGRGVQEPQIRDRIGPSLRWVCGVTAATSHSDARRALIGVLTEAATALPSELGLAARVMFAIDEEHQHRFLRQRYEALAARWNCDFRTVQRRGDEALTLVADHLTVRGEPPGPAAAAEQHETDAWDDDSWYLERFSAILLLNREQPEAIEERTVVSTIDGLTRLAVPLGIPRHPREERAKLGVDMNILYGAEPESVERRGEKMFVQYLRLPRPLARGERHVWARTARIPDGQLMTPRYVHIPLRRCDQFEVRLKFHRDRLPRVIWQVAKVPEFIFADQRPGREHLEPDALGEVHVRFTDLQLGLGYGVAWLPATGDHE
ncbi:MAG TPA: hypothetical protein VGD67_22640 [Pseudonocardiaceae bacterium]